MAIVGLAGTIACFIFGGVFLLITFLSRTTILYLTPIQALVFSGIGCGLLVCGWWIGSMTNNNDVN